MSPEKLEEIRQRAERNDVMEGAESVRADRRLLLEYVRDLEKRIRELERDNGVVTRYAYAMGVVDGGVGICEERGESAEFIADFRKEAMKGVEAVTDAYRAAPSTDGAVLPSNSEA